MPSGRCECGGELEPTKGPKIASVPEGQLIYRCKGCGRLFVVQLRKAPSLDGPSVGPDVPGGGAH